MAVKKIRMVDASTDNSGVSSPRKDFLQRIMGRLSRNSYVTDLVLLVVFLLLTFIFFQRKGYLSPTDHSFAVPHVHRQRNGQGFRLDSYDMTDERIRRIPDIRPSECKGRNWSPKMVQSASIIIHFFDYQFYDLKTTLLSVSLYTRPKFIAEIIVIDDGSTLDYIKTDSAIFLAKFEKVRVIRTDETLGMAKARQRGAAEAKSDVLVYLDTTVIVNAGWLEPLIAAALAEPNGIVVPHFDNVNDPVSYEYLPTEDNLASTFTWTLSSRMWSVPMVASSALQPIASPVMRGNSFATTSTFFRRVGGYDLNFHSDPAAENLELSWRAWMCGSGIQIQVCSRIGVMNLRDPSKVVSTDSVLRIGELWLGARRKLVYRAAKATDQSTVQAVRYADTRRAQLAPLQCKDFEWYLSHVASEVYTPSEDADHYGLLRCRTGRCARVGNDSRIDLGDCRAARLNLHASDMMFELTSEGQLRSRGLCATVLHTAYLQFQPCAANDTKQQFTYDREHRLINNWCSYCAMHVTDPDKKVPKNRQIAMVQECQLDKSGQYVAWDFILP